MEEIKPRRLPLLWRVYAKGVKLAALPLFLHFYLLRHQVGGEYGIGLFTKLRLFRQILRAARSIESGTSWHEQVLLASEVLRIPRSSEGFVAECGCFKGSSTASLSLACALTGRKLIVFDSFEGLPEPDGLDRAHVLPHAGEVHTYEKGAFRGALDEVKSNIAAYGALASCEFVKGFYNESMPRFAAQDSRTVALAFCDVDFRSSLEDCVTGLWPRLENDRHFFVHEAHHIEIPALFFDEPWWASRMHESAPGLVGAGCGLTFGVGYKTGLGYAIKAMTVESTRLEVVPQDIGDSRLSADTVKG